MKHTEFYLLEEGRDGVAVAAILNTLKEAEAEKEHRERLFEDSFFWIEESDREPVCVTI